MSWNGTVRCSWCYQTGHNKRTCPEYTAILKERAEQEIANNEGYDGYWGRQYNKRVNDGLYADGTPMSDEHLNAAKVRGGKVRRCTYCGAKGHNRRTCPTLKENKEAYVVAAIAFRRRLVDAMRSAGIGVGALVSTERWGDTYCWMVTKINWSEIDHLRVGHCDPVMGQNVRTVDRYNQQQWMALPALEDEQGEVIENRRGLSQLVGPVVLAGVPADFFEPESLTALMDDRFDKDARSVDYWDNYHG